jgi:phosphate-selective porin OprO/OprP
VKPYKQFLGMGRNAGFCGGGAWEIAARWSYLDLSAKNVKAANYIASASTPPSPNPGVLNESTVALNWWWNEYTRIEFDWIHCMLDNNLHGFSSMDIAATRVQVEF